MLNFKTLLYKAILILICLALFILYNNAVKEKNRIKQNFETVINKYNNAITLNTEELTRNYKDIAELRKQLNIREKEVVTVFKTNIVYKDSLRLIKQIDTVFKIDTFLITTKYNYKDSCLTFLAEENNNKLFINYKIEDKLTGILSWYRPHKFLFLRWGAKRYKLDIYSKCKRDTFAVENLIIVK